jgi:hypothetical protein
MSSLPLLLPRTARMILVLQKPDDVSEPVRNPDEAKIKFKGLHSEMTRLISPTDHYLTEPNFGPRTHLNGKGLVQLGYDAFEKIFEAPHLTVDSM